MKLGSKSRALTMLVIGGLLGAIMLSPVAAGPNDPATKKFVKQLVKKKVNKAKNQLQTQIDNRYTKTEADDKFQKEAELLFATVNNAGMANVEVLNGRGVVDVDSFVGTIVTFNRPINNCTWTATYQRTSSNEEWYAQVAPNSATSVVVWLSDGTDILNNGAGERFHLVVICP